MLKVNTDEKECGVNGEEKETNTKRTLLGGTGGLDWNFSLEVLFIECKCLKGAKQTSLLFK